MAVALTLQRYLYTQGVTYDCREHKQTGCSSQSAKAINICNQCWAKAVVLKCYDGFCLRLCPPQDR